MKKSLLVALGLMSVLCLAACQKNPEPVAVDNGDEGETQVEAWMANPASVYCEENGGTLEMVSDENGEYGVCNLPDGTSCEEWAYYRGECPSEAEMKTSLTLADLDEIDIALFPTSYTYETYGLVWDVMEMIDSGEYVYPEGLDHSLLIPIHATMIHRDIVSSSIEDGMIYTLADITLQDETIVSVLYINNPTTLQYVAASVNNGDETTLYTFLY